jgi:hypothetical protein
LISLQRAPHTKACAAGDEIGLSLIDGMELETGDKKR